MDFELTEEQRMVQEMVRLFVDKELRPVASGLDRDGVYPQEQLTKLGEIGLLGMFVPEEYGGAGMDFLSYVTALEELSKVWASVGTIVSVNNSLMCGPILRFGTDAQRKRYLPLVARGEWLGCYALTEPDAGSDAGSIRTRAVRKSDHYVLNGSKAFTTNGNRANVALVYAITDPAEGKQGISAFLVERNTPGLVVNKIEDKLGLCSSETAALSFEDCQIPRENLLGREGEGLAIALKTLDGGRIGIAAQAVGIAQGCLEEALSYSQQRHQFGHPIAEFQAIQWMLADIATEIDAARLLSCRAAWLQEQEREVTHAAAMAKLFASEACNRAAY